MKTVKIIRTLIILISIALVAVVAQAATFSLETKEAVLPVSRNPAQPLKVKMPIEFKNRSGRTITLRGGAPLPIDDLKTDGHSAFYLDFSNVLSEKITQISKNISMDPSGPWRLSCYDRDDDEALCALTPEQDVTLKADESLTFNLQVIATEAFNTPRKLLVLFRNIPGLSNERADEVSVHVQLAPSSEKKDLAKLQRDFEEDNRVYVSVERPLDNTKIFYLSNPSPKEAIPAAPGESYFNFSFDTGEGVGDLAPKSDVLAFELDIFRYADKDKAHPWSCAKQRQDDPPWWNCTPKTSVLLDKGSKGKIEFQLSNVITHLEPGPANMYITYGNIPGYNDGYFTIPILKAKPKPAISYFMVYPANVIAGDEVDLSWATVAAYSVELEYEEGGVIRHKSSKDGQINEKEEKYAVTPGKTTKYTLYIKDKNNNLVGQSSEYVTVVNPPPEIVKFTGAYDPVTQKISLSWQTKHANRIRIYDAEGNQIHPEESGAYVYVGDEPVYLKPRIPESTGYILTAYDKDNRQTSARIDLKWEVTKNRRYNDYSAAIAVAPNGRIYIGDAAFSLVYVIDAVSYKVIEKIRIGPPFKRPDPRAIAVAPTGEIYVATRNTGAVWVIDPKTGKVIRDIGIGSGFGDMAVAPNGNVYVTNPRFHSIDVIKPGARWSERLKTDLKSPAAIAFGPLGRIYVANGFKEPMVSIVDPGSGNVIKSIGVDRSPAAIAVDPQGRLYVADTTAGTVSVYNPDGSKVKDAIKPKTGRHFPRHLAITPSGLLYVAWEGTSENPNTVTVVEPNSFKILETIPIGLGTPTITIGPHGNLYYVNYKGISRDKRDGEFGVIVPTVSKMRVSAKEN